MLLRSLRRYGIHFPELSTMFVCCTSIETLHREADRRQLIGRDIDLDLLSANYDQQIPTGGLVGIVPGVRDSPLSFDTGQVTSSDRPRIAVDSMPAQQRVSATPNLRLFAAAGRRRWCCHQRSYSRTDDICQSRTGSATLRPTDVRTDAPSHGMAGCNPL